MAFKIKVVKFLFSKTLSNQIFAFVEFDSTREEVAKGNTNAGALTSTLFPIGPLVLILLAKVYSLE